MSYSLNAFELDIPDVVADIYSVDPQPSGNPYSVLGSLERTIEKQLDGKAQKWKHTQKDEWYIAVVGASERKTIEAKGRGTTAEPKATHTLNPALFWDRMVLQRAISDSVKWYFQEYQDFWYHDDADALFYSSSRGRTGEYDIYTGFSHRVEFHEVPQLVVQSVTKFVESDSLATKIDNGGIEKAEQRYGGRNFMLDRPEPTNCTLHGISKNKSVSDKTINYRGEKTSVVEFARRRYGTEWADKIDPNEPLIQIRFGDSDPYDTAPSLLKGSPENLNRRLTSEAALSAHERWKAIRNFIKRINYVQIEGEEVQIDSDPISPSVQGEFDYPKLCFGGEAVLSTNGPNAVNPSQQVQPKNWRWATKDYLQEYGFWRAPRKIPEIVLVYPNGYRSRAESLYADIQETLSDLGGIKIRSDPHRICYSDRGEFDQWVGEFGDTVDGVIGLLEGEGDEYYEIIDRFDGLPAQFMNVSSYPANGNVSDDVILNTALGFAVKMGAYPFGLPDELGVDLYLGLSVAGKQSTTATAVLIDGRTGELLYQTEEPLSQGNSTVSGAYPAKRILQDSVRAARVKFDRPIESLEIHRNGRFGDTEIEIFSSELSELRDQEHISPDLAWSAIEVIENHTYRLFANSGNQAPLTGAYTKLDADNILVTTFGAPQIHQGTPKPIMCRERETSNGRDIEEIGKDVFTLSFLNWGSPMMKMKSPITTKIPKELNEIFEKCSRVRYPPF